LQALVTGITGQDGGYLVLHLLQTLGYDRIISLVRRTSEDNPISRLRLPELITHLGSGRLKLEYGDVTDLHSIVRILRDYPGISEVYNLAGQTHVGISFDMPLATFEINGIGPVNVLEAIRVINPEIRLYQASTSEMFGDAAEMFCPQDEQTPFWPNSPYGCAKAYAHRMLVNARQYRNKPVRTVCGIPFNHESEVRGENFVTRKITLAAARIRLGQQEVLELGNLDSERDWGYAPDYVVAMHTMLQQQSEPAEWQDYVIATGERRSVREFVSIAFEIAFSDTPNDLEWRGSGIDSVLLVNGVERVRVNPKFYRAKDINSLCGNPAKAIKELGWNPRRTSFTTMVKRMVAHDLAEEKS